VADDRAPGRRAFSYACHVADWAAIDGLVDVAYDRFGHIDILVNAMCSIRRSIK
jgi:NAD(P)-dependent dehydrogenase (short-subunit alcohol dehydrogenase family)